MIRLRRRVEVVDLVVCGTSQFSLFELREFADRLKGRRVHSGTKL